MPKLDLQRLFFEIKNKFPNSTFIFHYQLLRLSELVTDTIDYKKAEPHRNLAIFDHPYWDYLKSVGFTIISQEAILPKSTDVKHQFFIVAETFK